MGGYNSGGGRSASKTTDFLKIDLVDLKRLGMLTIGKHSSLCWSRNGAPLGNIRIFRSEDALLLDYRVRSPGEDWRAISEKVYFNRNPQNFGGERLWFICPACRRNCRVLYGGAHFRCRRCWRATYPSQYEPYYDRLLSRVQAVRVKLGGSGSMDEPFPAKPMRMRRRTYERLQKRDEEAQNMFWRICDDWLARLEYRNRR